MELSSCYWVPKGHLTAKEIKAFTLKVYNLDGTVTEVECLRRDRKGYLGVPRHYGIRTFGLAGVHDLRSFGAAVGPVPRLPVLRPDQEPLVDTILGLHAAGESDFCVRAATGKGKTVMALYVAAALGLPAVIMVDQENLMDQWVERAEQHLGLTRDQIGIVRGDRCDYQGKALTICMVQTLVRRTYPAEFYSYFGVAVFDESHTAGAPTFSRALMMFDAVLRFGLSATPHRGDALDTAIEWNIGPIMAELYDPPGAASVYVMESYSVYSWAANNSKMTGRYMSEIAEDGERNLRQVEAIEWLYQQSREVLVIGERVSHLCAVMALCRARGMPADAMGLYAKSRVVYRLEKDPTPGTLPDGYERGTEYTPIHFAMVQKTVPKPEREAALASARIVFATYSSMSKGVDCPRLSGGVDLAPRSGATQVYGRILRVLPGKLRPIWITTVDVNSFRSLYQLSERLNDYDNSNAEVYLWRADKGRRKLNLTDYLREIKSRTRDLRSTQIVTRLDGRNMLKTPSMQKSRGA